MNLRASLLILIVEVAVAVLSGCAKEKEQPGAKTPSTEVQAPEKGNPSGTAVSTLPRLVDLGRGTCIPCKQMAPILKELTEEYKGRALVEVIDLRFQPQAAMEYGINLIPTQIFFDDKGVEVWRHEGFLPKDQIVAKFAELGVKPK